jgi:hypothetical protein
MWRRVLLWGVIGLMLLSLVLVSFEAVTPRANEAESSMEVRSQQDATFNIRAEVQLPDLHALFPATEEYYNSPYNFSLRSLEVATLHLPSDTILATDPFWSDMTPPFSQKVAPGDYPVVLSLTRREQNESEDVAAAKVVFSSNEVVRWELALADGEDLGQLEAGKTMGYMVDSSTASFSGPESAKVFMEKMYPAAQGNQLNESYLNELSQASEAHANEGAWLSHQPDLDSPNNIVMFASGYGKGSYGSYWGYDANGQVVCLITDFAIFAIEDLPIPR